MYAFTFVKEEVDNLSDTSSRISGIEVAVMIIKCARQDTNQPVAGMMSLIY